MIFPVLPFRTPLLAALAAGLLAACSPGGGDGGKKLAAVEIDQSTACSLDGMLLSDYPGPKAQIFYADRPEPEFFCDTVEMFSIYLKPEQVRPVKALFVQDMGKADWDQPRGAWIDAKTAWYVLGSSRHGSMGPTIGSFAQQTDAEKFAQAHGGKALAFDSITPDMAVLDGGALHDSKM
ncbi:nitrous oxide reductase accessory protein NosL [Aromatoleum toluclasticum]|uniref:nitrous oxide reductase accessory protein NosL n=1 Tax=Aromatoleum toluclasticum TaxID=92003 RepID=UPI001D192EFE|nr:nitrous oxide reductase accessory protein NosL [Aromatoleum toluclasticum]MCC4116614.1 nitrous oxide reductase accessory protein NosL [Aromatoleum toluclasticum]